MKYLVKIFVVTFFLLVSTYTMAEQKIVYIDMKYVLNNSKAGKGAQDYLAKSFKQNQKKFSDQQEQLKKEEADLLGKKNILNKDDKSLENSVSFSSSSLWNRRFSSIKILFCGISEILLNTEASIGYEINPICFSKISDNI